MGFLCGINVADSIHFNGETRGAGGAGSTVCCSWARLRCWHQDGAARPSAMGCWQGSLRAGVDQGRTGLSISTCRGQHPQTEPILLSISAALAGKKWISVFSQLRALRPQTGPGFLSLVV